jgi:hypothetical protein
MTFDYIDKVKQIVLKHVPNNAFAIFLFGVGQWEMLNRYVILT